MAQSLLADLAAGWTRHFLLEQGQGLGDHVKLGPRRGGADGEGPLPGRAGIQQRQSRQPREWVIIGKGRRRHIASYQDPGDKGVPVRSWLADGIY